MKYPKEYLDEIKTRIKVSQVVGKSVKLKKRGKEFIGLSPFSNEKTPSFTINDEKGFYHCFSSGEHGNIFDFLMKIKNYKFGEAVRTLATDAGMQPYRFTKQDEEMQKKWKIYNTILEKYANFCHGELDSGRYSELSAYINKRKITKEEIIFFKIGYSPVNNNFYEQLGREFNEEQIGYSGIYYFDENKKKYIDRFRGRIIFPITNINGSVTAFAGRTITNSKFAKYINSPETPFFKKGNNLYNINNAKKISNANQEVFFVEGYMDVISLHKFGIKNVVANQGTALTEKQLELSWNFFKNSIICFDGDTSGNLAAIRAAERLFPIMKLDHSISFLFLPNNLDPDNYIHQNGKNRFINLTKEKIPIYDFLWSYHYQSVNTNDPSSLASFENKIKKLCNQIIDRSLSKYFLEYFLSKLAQLTPFLNSRRNNFYKFKKASNPLSQTKKTSNQREQFSKTILKEYSILYIVTNNLNFFSKKIEIISEVIFFNERTKIFKEKLINTMASGQVYNKTTFENCFANSEFKNLIGEINQFAPVKIIIHKKKEEEVNAIFNEICNELQQIDLKDRIESLEEKVARKMDQQTYQELLDLKSKAKRG